MCKRVYQSFDPWCQVSRSVVPTACLAVLLDAHSALQLAISLTPGDGDAQQLQACDTAVVKQVIGIVTVGGSVVGTWCRYVGFFTSASDASLVATAGQSSLLN